MTTKLDRYVTNELKDSGVTVCYRGMKLHCFVHRDAYENWKRIKIALCALTGYDIFQDYGDGTCVFEDDGGKIGPYSEYA